MVMEVTDIVVSVGTGSQVIVASRNYHWGMVA